MHSVRTASVPLLRRNVRCLYFSSATTQSRRPTGESWECRGNDRVRLLPLPNAVSGVLTPRLLAGLTPSTRFGSCPSHHCAPFRKRQLSHTTPAKGPVSSYYKSVSSLAENHMLKEDRRGFRITLSARGDVITTPFIRRESKKSQGKNAALLRFNDARYAK